MAHGLEMRAPFLDHRFYAAVLGLPDAARFTTPPKQLLAPALAPLADRAPFTRKKRGFNPPLAGWLEGDLAPRLAVSASGLPRARRAISTPRASMPMSRPGATGGARLAEQILQLVLLDESLAQLAALAAVD